MKQKLIDTNVIHTSVGTFRREIIVYELTGKGCEVSTSIFFNEKEYNDASELACILGPEKYKKLKSEVEMYSTVLDCFMSTFLNNNNN